MKQLAFVFLSVLALSFTACTKEGPAGPAGAAGPAGPAGPAGENANYSIGEYTVAGADFQANYTEFQVAEITEDVMDAGVVLVYVQDSFGYWNQIPSNWTPIIGFSYIWTADTGGILGLDHDDTPVLDSYVVRVVTMFQRDYELLDEGVVADFDQLMEVLTTK